MRGKRMYLVLIALTVVVLLGVTACAPFRGYAPSGRGGGMGPGMMGDMPMMGGMMGYYSGVPMPLSHEDAKAIADNYLAWLSNPELEIDELEEYSHNFYLSLVEKSTGRGAIEIIIDRYSGSYQPEPQSMMWNGKYGMMGGSQQAQMTVTSESALIIAQDFLDVVYPGTEGDEIVAYYGYYTIMTKLEGKHYGMLSVNGYSGDVWYHTWHGMFISEVEE
ncbi:MAG: peptidase M4 [Chloroflexota bacterium]